MKRSLNLLIALLFSTSISSQVPIGNWRDHYSYYQGQKTAIGPDRVFVSVPNGLFWYKPSTGEVGKLSTVNGLSDIGISAIEYSPYQDLLAVGYENGNIDLVLKDQVVNLPYIDQKPMQGSKQINNFHFTNDELMYVSTGFGIVVVNLDKREIKDTYYIGSGGSDLWVNQVTTFNNRIYAATREGLYSASTNDPLLILFSNWFIEQGIPGAEAEYSSLAVFDGKLIAVQATSNEQPDAIHYFDSFAWSQLSNQYNKINNIAANNNLLAISSRQGISTFQTLSGPPNTINNYMGFDNFFPNHIAVDTNNKLVVADNYIGLMYGTSSGWTPVAPNSPVEDKAFFVLPTSDDLYVVGGSRSDVWGNRFYPIIVHKFSNNQWAYNYNFNYIDAVRITQSPFHSNEFYISSWGNGILVYRDGQFIENYNPSNSSLETIIPGAFCRIGGVVFDSKGNLWASNAGVTNPISIRTPDGTWKGFPYQSLVSSQRQSDIVLSPSGHLWVIIPSGGGLFVLNPGNDPLTMSSHQARKLMLTDSDGASLPNDIYSIAFDREGYLWIGTNEGVLVSYNPQRVFEPSLFNAQRVKIPDVVQGLAVFLLESETVTTIAIDGADRKWFGTQRSGVFLQSADGSRQLLNFTKENSPLPSNNIQHIGIHPKTGEVFFATDKGLISYRGDATEPSSRFGKVYAFPNPVRPDYNGVITITGLVDKTIVKITDVAGNLVYETQSLGGQATWDGKNIQGNRVSTGVYLFFCADSMGEQSAVGKILFVK